jgi:hypothetical protein
MVLLFVICRWVFTYVLITLRGYEQAASIEWQVDQEAAAMISTGLTFILKA